MEARRWGDGAPTVLRGPPLTRGPEVTRIGDSAISLLRDPGIGGEVGRWDAGPEEPRRRMVRLPAVQGKGGTGRSVARYRACFGSRRSPVRIRPPRWSCGRWEAVRCRALVGAAAGASSSVGQSGSLLSCGSGVRIPPGALGGRGCGGEAGTLSSMVEQLTLNQ